MDQNWNGSQASRSHPRRAQEAPCATSLAGLERIPALVKDVTDEQVAVFALVENLHREDLNPIEKARAFARIQELTRANQDEVARQVGIERSTLTNFLRLLDLPGEVQAHVSRGTLSMGQARALLGLADEHERKAVAEDAIRRRLSVRQVEALVQSLKTRRESPAKGSPTNPAPQPETGGRPLWLKEIEDNLSEALQAQVRVRYTKKRSSFVIECEGRDEFERLYERLRRD